MSARVTPKSDLIVLSLSTVLSVLLNLEAVVINGQDDVRPYRPGVFGKNKILCDFHEP